MVGGAGTCMTAGVHDPDGLESRVGEMAGGQGSEGPFCA